MKKFKSILALTASVLALSAFAAPVSAFANDTNTNGTWDDNPAGTTNFSLENAESYTVTIPSTVTFASVADTSKSVTVTASNVVLAPEKKLKVTVDSENDYALVLNDDSIAYSATLNDTQITDTTLLIDTPASPTDVTCNIPLAITGTNALKYAGSYTDTWTFTVTAYTP